MERQVFIFCLILFNCIELFSQKAHRFELEGNLAYGRLIHK